MGNPSRRTRFAACAVAAGAVLSGLVPAAGAAAAPASAPPSAARAADDPVPGNEGMPDDGFDNESEGEQDDFAGTGTGTGTGEWVPQAITGVSDAQEDEDWGTSNTEPIAVAGYDAENPGRSDYASGSDNCLLSPASGAKCSATSADPHDPHDRP
ncbi:hypothetical protein SAMN02787144_10172 [Streptomyces atratus]|uniref:Uncharacterized protein n=1 Tax=Streptomyces atratus TaxID=1893 RepID=A0A1K2E4P7_STRAR|nr:hypothetical protein SAMN02787144_10172 [Streptomyces atratus]